MPYSSIEGAQKAGFPTSAEDIALTLEQINNLAEIYDSVKEAGTAENPMAVAWTTWKKTHKKEGDKWVKVEKKTYDLETVDLKDVEIFSAESRPNGHDYSEKDLEEMVLGFYETQKKIKPYLKLGHPDEQKFLQKSGWPAFGWIENLKKVGKKLVADFVSMPKKIYELVKAKAYNRVSSEIFWNITVNNKKYKRLLKAVSLLGADTPACMDLDDIISLYSADFDIYKTNNEIETYEFDIDGEKIIEQKKEEEDMAKIEELELEKKELQAKVDKLTLEAQEKDEVAKKALEAKANAEKELETKKEAETKTEIEGKVDKLITDGHWYPADKDVLIAKLTDERKAPEVKKYKVGEEEKTFEEFFFETAEKFTVDLNTQEQTEIGDMASKEDNRALQAKAEKYAKENKVSYPEALKAVAPQK